MYLSIFYRGILLFAWAVFILTLLLTPMPYTGESGTVTYSDKILHAMIFGVFAFLIFYFLKGIEENNWRKENKKSSRCFDVFCKILHSAPNLFILSFFSTVFYSLVLERTQYYVPGRSMNELDFIASIIGTILVLLFVYGDNYYKKT